MAGQSPSAIPNDAVIAAHLARRVDIHHLCRGMVAGVTDAGVHRVVAHGIADPVVGRSVGADTLFEIGSITKLFTALVLAGMIDDGKLAVGDPVEELLPSGVAVPSRKRPADHARRPR